MAATDYFAATAGYRTALAGTYYPTEYHAALGNGYLDVSTAGSRISSLASYDQVELIRFLLNQISILLKFSETVRSRQTVQQCSIHV